MEEVDRIVPNALICLPQHTESEKQYNSFSDFIVPREKNIDILMKWVTCQSLVDIQGRTQLSWLISRCAADQLLGYVTFLVNSHLGSSSAGSHSSSVRGIATSVAVQVLLLQQQILLSRQKSESFRHISILAQKHPIRLGVCYSGFLQVPFIIGTRATSHRAVVSLASGTTLFQKPLSVGLQFY